MTISIYKRTLVGRDKFSPMAVELNNKVLKMIPIVV